MTLTEGSKKLLAAKLAFHHVKLATDKTHSDLRLLEIIDQMNKEIVKDIWSKNNKRRKKKKKTGK